MNLKDLPKRYRAQAAAQGADESPLEAQMAVILRSLAQERAYLGECVRQYRFHPERRFRFDFAYPNIKVAIECDGGQWLDKSGHNTGSGYESDREKDLEAALLGWRVFRFTGDMVEDGRALAYLERMFPPF